MKEYHDLTFVGTLGKRVHDLKVNKKITQGTAENAMKLLNTMSHGLCDPAPEWSETKSTTTTMERTRTFSVGCLGRHGQNDRLLWQQY